MAALQAQSEPRDVVVIGSGAGGATVAHVLTDLGIRVTVLEAGPMLDPYQEFKEHDWPYSHEHRGAEDGGQRYFGTGKPFGFLQRPAVAGNSTESLIPLQTTPRIFGGSGHGLLGGVPTTTVECLFDLLITTSSHATETVWGGIGRLAMTTSLPTTTKPNSS